MTSGGKRHKRGKGQWPGGGGLFGGLLGGLDLEGAALGQPVADERDVLLQLVDVARHLRGTSHSAPPMSRPTM